MKNTLIAIITFSASSVLFAVVPAYAQVASSTVIIDNPTQDLWNGFVLFGASALIIVWLFRRPRL